MRRICAVVDSRVCCGSVCTQCMYAMHVRNACTQCMYAMHVHEMCFVRVCIRACVRVCLCLCLDGVSVH